MKHDLIPDPLHPRPRPHPPRPRRPTRPPRLLLHPARHAHQSQTQTRPRPPRPPRPLKTRTPRPRQRLSRRRRQQCAAAWRPLATQMLPRHPPPPHRSVPRAQPARPSPQGVAPATAARKTRGGRSQRPRGLPAPRTCRWRRRHRCRRRRQASPRTEGATAPLPPPAAPPLKTQHRAPRRCRSWRPSWPCRRFRPFQLCRLPAETGPLGLKCRQGCGRSPSLSVPAATLRAHPACPGP
mmetsp:Transcript_39731/g.118240  ORF Transcript_39731/g.118240 Transcript_39731/m.118240 type:complete len:238 (+) Transcript_39731:203-916(+)|eukprot:360136-Chlamydomonas_euryale.AAC.2